MQPLSTVLLPEGIESRNSGHLCDTGQTQSGLHSDYSGIQEAWTEAMLSSH